MPILTTTLDRVLLQLGLLTSVVLHALTHPAVVLPPTSMTEGLVIFLPLLKVAHVRKAIKLYLFLENLLQISRLAMVIAGLLPEGRVYIEFNIIKLATLNSSYL